MENSKKYNLFNSFLKKDMTEEELTEFKSALTNDVELKKEFVIYLLNASDGMKVIDPELRVLVKEVYSETKSISYQLPERSYVVKRFAQDNWHRVAIAAALVFAILIGISRFFSPADFSEPQFAALMIEPISMERAGVADAQSYERASFYYFQDTPLTDSLETLVDNCPSFCPGHYYLAHAYLKTGLYEKALAQFEFCLQSLDQINQIPQLQGSDAEIHFNIILTKLAINKDPDAAKKDLNTLKDALDPKDALHKKIGSVMKLL